MKPTKNLIAGALVVGALLALTTPALADDRDWRRDLGELNAAHGELRSDLRRGAGPAEIARDRAAIARERNELFRGENSWSWNRSNRYYGRWNRWENRDRDSHRGWWR